MRNGPFFFGGIGNFQKDHNKLCTRKIVKIVLALAEPWEKKNRASVFYIQVFSFNVKRSSCTSYCHIINK